jgi:hypothetical protein
VVRFDFDEGNIPIGMESTTPGVATITESNAVLAQLGLAAFAEEGVGLLAA